MPKSYLIHNATLIQHGHAYHLTPIDILITDGIITAIGKGIKSDAEHITGEEIFVSAGWVDTRCHLTDPGNEHKDTLAHLLDTASAGGFTKIVTLPHSEPVISDKSLVKYVIQSGKNHTVDIRPTGVLSSTDNPENLAELYDMHTAGAVAFTNGDHKVSNGLLKKSLLYVKPFGGRIMTHPSDKSLEHHGMVNESETTVHTGLKTSPALAEYIQLKEHIEVAKYCDAPVHFSTISCKESVEIIRNAKKEGLQITCDVAIANLCFTDKEVLNFDENFKLYPPLRTEEDRLALIQGVKDGTIDAICSNHAPQNIENKELEFDYADYGALTLQLLYVWYIRYLSSELELSLFVNALTTNANACIQENSPKIEVGSVANLTVFDSKATWVLDASSNKSLSKNSHQYNQTLKGKVVAVFNNNHTHLNK